MSIKVYSRNVDIILSIMFLPILLQVKLFSKGVGVLNQNTNCLFICFDNFFLSFSKGARQKASILSGRVR